MWTGLRCSGPELWAANDESIFPLKSHQHALAASPKGTQQWCCSLTGPRDNEQWAALKKKKKKTLCARRFIEQSSQYEAAFTEGILCNCDHQEALEIRTVKTNNSAQTAGIWGGKQTAINTYEWSHNKQQSERKHTWTLMHNLCYVQKYRGDRKKKSWILIFTDDPAMKVVTHTSFHFFYHQPEESLRADS